MTQPRANWLIYRLSGGQSACQPVSFSRAARRPHCTWRRPGRGTTRAGWRTCSTGLRRIKANQDARLVVIDTHAKFRPPKARNADSYEEAGMILQSRDQISDAQAEFGRFGELAGVLDPIQRMKAQ